MNSSSDEWRKDWQHQRRNRFNSFLYLQVGEPERSPYQEPFSVNPFSSCNDRCLTRRQFSSKLLGAGKPILLGHCYTVTLHFRLMWQIRTRATTLSVQLNQTKRCEGNHRWRILPPFIKLEVSFSFLVLNEMRIPKPSFSLPFAFRKYRWVLAGHWRPTWSSLMTQRVPIRRCSVPSFPFIPSFLLILPFVPIPPRIAAVLPNFLPWPHLSHHHASLISCRWRRQAH